MTIVKDLIPKSSSLELHREFPSLLKVSHRNSINLSYKMKRMRREAEFASSNQKQFASLTIREKEIIILLLRGLNNPKIAQELFISRRTVEQHRKNINRKLGIQNFTDLVMYGYAFDLV